MNKDKLNKFVNSEISSLCRVFKVKYLTPQQAQPIVSAMINNMDLYFVLKSKATSVNGLVDLVRNNQEIAK